MITPSRADISPAEAQVLHARLLNQDPTAPADLAATFLDPLTDWLEARNPRLGDPHLCAIAAEEAILSLIKRPESYDPARLPLDRYLRMAARRDLQNLLRAERRHSDRRADWEAVELSPVVGNYLWDAAGDPARIVEAREVRREVAPSAPPPLPDLTPEEVRVLALMRARERKTAAYALALGCTHLPIEEQRRAVKRAKDRLQKRLARAGGDHG